tara:strand:- start:440 stop:676 length:237 start_codon:yes stop_codon:yes gene_type:complete
MKEIDISRIIEMAWEDRTPFEAIKENYDLSESQVKSIMKKELRYSSYKLWRERVYGRKTKHLSRRTFSVGRHKSPNKR